MALNRYNNFIIWLKESLYFSCLDKIFIQKKILPNFATKSDQYSKIERKFIVTSSNLKILEYVVI